MENTEVSRKKASVHGPGYFINENESENPTQNLKLGFGSLMNQ